MTICIAAIAEHTSVIGASDRMLTAGDIQFEPGRAKTRTLTSSIVAMTAGDASLQEEVLIRVKVDVANQLENHPDVWVDVSWVAHRYVTHWTDIKRERAERAILWPLGIESADDFLARHASFSEKLGSDIATELLRFSVPSTACIVAGVDTTGPQLWHAEDGQLVCLNAVGFAAIGSGGRRAESHMMLAQHCASTSLSDTLLLVHSAKKRAEISPGVGSATDLWLIGPQLGSWTPVSEDIVGNLDAQFCQIQQDERNAMESAKAGISTYLANIPPPMDAIEQKAEDEASPVSPPASDLR